jgi:hypothetical protein
MDLNIKVFEVFYSDLVLGILVRDDGARQELRQQVGDIGLIMFVHTPGKS